MQVIHLDAADLLADSDVGQITIGMLRELEGEDLRVVGDAFLNDGRILIEWHTQSSGLMGSTYFWLRGTELNVLTLKHTSEHIVVYRSRLAEIAESFHFKSE